MKIRRIQYDIEFTHILTFQEEYRKKMAKFFTAQNLRYGIENIGTLDESIKFIYSDFHLIIQCSKGAIRLAYEGDPNNFVKGGSPHWDLFAEFFGAIKSIEGFGRIVRHFLQVQAVHILEPDLEVKELGSNFGQGSNYLKFTPFKLDNFAIVYESGDAENVSKVTFGNFSKKEIKRYDLSPFATQYNSDLFTGEGYMADILMKKPLDKFSKNAYKDLFSEINQIIQKFDMK